MKIIKPKFNQIIKLSIISFFLVIVTNIASGQSSADREIMLDLLDTPSYISAHALQSIQLGVSAAGERLVMVGEQGVILLSDDNGSSWRQSKGVPVSVTLTAVYFVSSLDGWAVGHSGVILRTKDGGENWILQMDGYKAANIIYQEAKRRLDAGILGAESALRNAEYLLKEGADKPFLDLFFLDNNRGWVVGAYGIALYTRDGGDEWESIVDLIPNTDGRHFYSIQVENRRVVITGEQGSIFRNYLLMPKYERIETPYEGTFFGFVLLPKNNLIAFGLRGNVWRNNGNKWQKIELGSEVTLTAGLKLDSSRILLADEGGSLFISDDNGFTFRNLNISSVPSITDMSLSDDGALILSTARGPVRIEYSTFAMEEK